MDTCGYARNTLAQYARALKWYWLYVSEEHLDWQSPTIDSLAGWVRWLKSPFGSQKVVPTYPHASARTNGAHQRHHQRLSHGDHGVLRLLLADGRSSLPPARHRHHLPAGPGAALQRAPPRSCRGESGRQARAGPARKPAHATKDAAKEEVRQLREACGNARDRLLVGLLYETAMRIGEALALWLEDIDLAELEVRVRDRGPLENGAEIKTCAAERDLHVSEDLVHEILTYVAQAHTSAVTTNHLFVKQHGVHRGEPLTYADVDALFRRLRRKTRIKVTPHTLRHTMLTTLAEEDWAPEALQARAGHASFQYTYQTYVHPSGQRQREEWERTQETTSLVSPAPPAPRTERAASPIVNGE
jgi:integrase/recombinase XerD